MDWDPTLSRMAFPRNIGELVVHCPALTSVTRSNNNIENMSPGPLIDRDPTSIAGMVSTASYSCKYLTKPKVGATSLGSATFAASTKIAAELGLAPGAALASDADQLKLQSARLLRSVVSRHNCEQEFSLQEMAYLILHQDRGRARCSQDRFGFILVGQFLDYLGDYQRILAGAVVPSSPLPSSPRSSPLPPPPPPAAPSHLLPSASTAATAPVAISRHRRVHTPRRLFPHLFPRRLARYNHPHPVLSWTMLCTIL
jgi:hypothetical protein